MSTSNFQAFSRTASFFEHRSKGVFEFNDDNEKHSSSDAWIAA
jgi:hypothetical protein